MNSRSKNRFSIARLCAAVFVLGAVSPLAAQSTPAQSTPAETPDEWVALGKRVHGGFGSYIALGIRIGLDARRELDAGWRELDVTYISGSDAPCACAADGLMISTDATPGQSSLRVTTEKTPDAFGIAVIRHKKSLRAIRYTIPLTARPFLDNLNKKSERERFDAVMDAPRESLFHSETETVSRASFPLPPQK